MPAMPRMTKKDQKLYERIMGTPPNRIDDSSDKQREVRKELDFQDTTIAR